MVVKRRRNRSSDRLEDGPTNTGTRPQVRKARFDGWTAARRETFLDTLAQTANITLAADAAGMGRCNVYKLRKRDPAFEAEWQSALKDGVGFLEFRLLERAMNGDEKPYFHSGERCGELIEYPDRVAMFLVSRHLPKDGAGDRSSMERLAALRSRQEAARAKLEAKLDEVERRSHGDD